MTESQALERAMRRRITDFEGKAGAMALRFAYHAALPVALDADLLHLLRINFFLDPPELLAYTVEADLLLSSLCTEIRDGLYEIESDMRDYLLAELFTVYGQERIRDIATLLWQYTENYAPWEAHPGLQRAQQLTALNFLEPQQAQGWLNTAEASVAQQGVSLERQWFVAMRQDLQRQQVIQEKQDEQDSIKRKQLVQSTTILIVDDNIKLAEGLKRSIDERTKYTAITVNIAQDVLDVALRVHPCLMLLDYQLPENGLELYDRLQEYEEVRNIPTIMMGATLPIEALNLRNIYHLRKPLDIEVTLNMITRALAEFAEKQRDTSAVGGVSPGRLEEMDEALQSRQELYMLYKMFLQFVEEITHSGYNQLFLLSKDTRGEEKLQLIAYFAGSDVVIIDNVDEIILSDWNIGAQSGKPQIIRDSSSESSTAFEDYLFTETPDPLERSTRQCKLYIPLLNPKTGLMIGVINVQGDFPFSSSVGVQVETLASTCAIVLLRIQEKQVSRLLKDSYRLYTQRRFHDAQALYEQLLRIDRNNAQAWQGQGLTQAKNGQHQEALHSFDRALNLEPTLITSLNGKGAALNMLHRNQEALEVFEQALKLEPDNALSWNGQGAVFSALNRLMEALDAFTMALSFAPTMAQAWSNRGMTLRQLKRYEESLQDFEQALTYEPDSVLFWHNKGLTLYGLGRLNDAQQAYQEALERDQKYAPALYGIGNVYYAQQKLREALDYFDKAIISDRNSAEAWYRRGLVLGDLERFNDALTSYDRALAIDPQFAAAWNGKGSVLYKLEEYSVALGAHEQAIRLNRNAPLAWNGMGNAHYQMGNYQKALDGYEQALRLNPRMISALHNKSLVLRLMRRYDEALEAAEAAIHLAPNDPDNWKRKAEALRKLRRGNEARTAEAEVKRLQERSK